jgi:excinuclease ABC subunit B
VKDPSRPFTGSRFRAALRDLQGRLREAVDTAAPRRWRAEANAEKAERFRKGRL